MNNCLKRTIVVAIVIIGILAIGTEVKASVKDDIKTEISGQLKKGNVVKKIYYYDYDNNGTKEAFVLTGKKTSNEDEENDLWFAYVKEGKIYASIMKSLITL